MGESENRYIEFFYINQYNIHRLTFMQKIKKSDNPNWIYAPKMVIFAIFLYFRHPEGEQPDFSVRQAMQQTKGLICL